MAPSLPQNGRSERRPQLTPMAIHLFDRISKRLGILPHAAVPRDDGYQRRRVAEQLRGREVDGVECADRFDRKGAADSVEHRSINVEDEAAPLEGSEGPHGGLLLFRRQTTSRARSNDGPPRFCECQSRSHLLRAAWDLSYDGRVALQQRGDQGARLHVPHSRLGGHGAGWAGRRHLPGGAASWSPTLRHDRRR